MIEGRVDRRAPQRAHAAIDPEDPGEMFRYAGHDPLGDELVVRLDVLQVGEVPLGLRVEQEAVGRGPLAVDDRVRVGRGEQVVGQQLELVDRDPAVELAVGRVVEEVEPALEDVGLVGLLAEEA